MKILGGNIFMTGFIGLVLSVILYVIEQHTDDYYPLFELAYQGLFWLSIAGMVVGALMHVWG